MAELPIHKDLRSLCRKALRAGWGCERKGSGHFKLTSPEGPAVVIGSTPSSGGIRDARQQLRRAGLHV